MKSVLFYLCILLILIAAGCEKKVDMEAEKSALLAILAADDQELLSGVIKDDSTDVRETLSIIEGNLTRLTGLEANRRNRTLLEKGKFVNIENLDGPEIHISPDGNMAWIAVRTKFTIAYTDSLGMEKEWEGIEARLEVYEKMENKWECVVGAQTF